MFIPRHVAVTLSVLLTTLSASALPPAVRPSPTTHSTKVVGHATPAGPGIVPTTTGTAVKSIASAPGSIGHTPLPVGIPGSVTGVVTSPSGTGISRPTSSPAVTSSGAGILPSPSQPAVSPAPVSCTRCPSTGANSTVTKRGQCCPGGIVEPPDDPVAMLPQAPANPPTAPNFNQVPTVQALMSSAQGLPLTNAMFWTNDAAVEYRGVRLYQGYKNANHLRELRDLWPAQSFVQWDQLAQSAGSDSRSLATRFWQNSSQAIASLAGGDIVVVSCPRDPAEAGFNWSSNDEYWLNYELPILQQRFTAGQGIHSLTRINLDKTGRVVQRQQLLPTLQNPTRG